MQKNVLRVKYNKEAEIASKRGGDLNSKRGLMNRNKRS